MAFEERALNDFGLNPSRI